MIDRLIGDNPDAQQRTQAAQFLDALIDCGLVDLCRPYADQSRDAAGELYAWLEKNAPDHRLLPPLRALRASLDAYPHHTPSDQRQVDLESRRCAACHPACGERAPDSPRECGAARPGRDAAATAAPVGLRGP